MSDVTGVTRLSVEQLAVDDESAADAGRDDHREIRALVARRTEGAFGEREGAGVTVDEHVETERVTQSTSKRERSATAGC